jgi:hypothetical protein
MRVSLGAEIDSQHEFEQETKYFSGTVFYSKYFIFIYIYTILTIVYKDY